MINITDEFKQFMMENIHLLDEYRFEELYSLAYKHNFGVGVADFITSITESMLNLGVNPLAYMRCIPTFFLHKSEIEQIHIPDTVVIIRDHAMTHLNNLTKIIIPASVKKVEALAFSENQSLTDVYFMGEDTFCNMDAFAYCWQDIRMHVNKANKGLLELARDVWESEVVEI